MLLFYTSFVDPCLPETEILLIYYVVVVVLQIFAKKCVN